MKEKEIDQTFITAEDVAAFLFRVDHDWKDAIVRVEKTLKCLDLEFLDPRN